MTRGWTPALPRRQCAPMALNYDAQRRRSSTPITPPRHRSRPGVASNPVPPSRNGAFRLANWPADVAADVHQVHHHSCPWLGDFNRCDFSRQATIGLRDGSPFHGFEAPEHLDPAAKRPILRQHFRPSLACCQYHTATAFRFTNRHPMVVIDLSASTKRARCFRHHKGARPY